MKKILKSSLVVAAVAAIAIGGTIAYFSDVEESNDNIITAGTIDIAVDGENPWSADGQYSIANLLPSDDTDINVTLSNVGTNDVVVWAKVVATDSGNLMSEPECVAEGGTYDDATDVCSGNTPVDDVSSQFIYSMNIGGSTNIDQAWDVRVSDITDLWIPIGRINSGDSLAVDQNYYFADAAGNEYQGDEMDLDITFYAEQLDAPGPANTTRGVVLENKDASGDWAPIVADGTWGILTFDGAGNYIAKAWGMNSDTYRLTYWDGSIENAIGSTQTGTDLTFTGAYAGFATNTDAKYWVRPNTWTASSDANTLYESNLVN